MAKAQTSPDDLLTTPQAAAELSITSTRVLVLIKEGRLPATKHGPMWAIRRGDLDLVRDRPHGVHRTDWRDKKKPGKPSKPGADAKKPRA